MRKGPRPVPLEERFWRYVVPGNPDECWEWLASTNAKGYGKVAAGGEGAGWVLAHRASWVLHNGPVPGGLCVLHHCDNPPCVNPAHLWLGTKTDNAADRDAKGRHRCGPSPLTDEDVCVIRRLVAGGATQRSVASVYGITQSGVSALTLGKIRRAAGGPLRLIGA